MVSELPLMPVASASPGELNFGEISLNNSQTSSQILTISNLGDLPLEINAFNFENPAFNTGDLQDTSIEGQQSQEIIVYFNPTEVGSYLSELVLKTNAGDLTIGLSGKATMTTGLNSTHFSKINVYPNPNNGKFSIKSLDENILYYNIQNSLGEIILQQKTTGNFVQLDLSAQSKGLYFISIKTKSAVIVERVVVF